MGVGSVQLGPEALTLAAILNKQMGLSLGHTRQVLAYGFGLEVSRAGLCRALARLAGRAEPTYSGLVEAARQSPVNVVDETGWKVSGRLQWLHVAVSAQVTVYAILPGRGYEQSVVILGAEYAARPWYRLRFVTPDPMPPLSYWKHWYHVFLKRDYTLMQPLRGSEKLQENEGVV